jgi:hypothetical protein
VGSAKPAARSPGAGAKLVVSTNAFGADDPWMLVQSNSNFVQVLLEEGLAPARLHPVAAACYWLAYYEAQMRNGGAPQLVRNSKWSRGVVAGIRDGLERLGDDAHRHVFDDLCAHVKAQGAPGLKRFLSVDLDGYASDPMTRQLRLSHVGEHFRAAPSLLELLPAFLRASEDLVVMTIDEMYAHAESLVGHSIART